MGERLTTNEVPLPTDKLILIDLDKTLIDPQYQITDESVIGEIERVQSLGWNLGLSSDTALEPLKIWRKRFHLNGPLIAEKGSVVWLPDGRESAKADYEIFFTSLRSNLMKKLSEERIPFVFGDVTQFLRNHPQLPGMVDQRLVLIQAYRRYSMNFYGRALDVQGNLIIDNDLTQQIIDKLQGLIKAQPFEIEEDYNPEYGIFILAPRSVNKREGTLKMLELLGLEKVGIIGDSESDLIGEDIAVHYAVGNARPELKRQAVYVSSSEYTRGVKEILSRIKS